MNLGASTIYLPNGRYLLEPHTIQASAGQRSRWNGREGIHLVATSLLVATEFYSLDL